MSAPLLTLADAKEHLRITDSLHDNDVQTKLAEAQAIVLNYLAEEADPEWTPATVPVDILSQIKIFLTHLYEHRGDDMNPSASGSTPDSAVWDAMRRALARRRTQAIGVGTAP